MALEPPDLAAEGRMSRWFDILYRREEPPAPPAAPSSPAAEIPLPGDSPAASDETAAEAQRPSRGALKPVAPLPSLPGRWALEVQKIVFHLHPPERDKPPPRHLVFSGMQKRDGTTTICYLVAHHLATERSDQRVLHVDFSVDRKRAATPGADAYLKIGQPLSSELFSSIAQTFTRFSIRPGDEHSVATTSGWIREFMTLARAHCDWVLIDAPPFSAASETYSVAKACDGVILILKSGETRYPALNALVADLELLGITVFGTVLNFRQYPIPRWLLKYI